MTATADTLGRPAPMPPPPDDLPGFLHAVAPVLDRWSYWALAVVIGVESFGVPAPGQTLMVAASIYAGAGRLNIWAVAAISFVAAVLGDNVGYWIGLRGGRKLVHRFGRYILVTPERLERAERFFARRGNGIVVVARFIDGLRQLNGVIAGVTRMPWRRFLLYNAVGAALWVGWWTTVAYLAGTHLVTIIEQVHRYQWWAVGAGALAVGGYVWLHVRHRRRRRARAAAAADGADQPDDDAALDAFTEAQLYEAERAQQEKLADEAALIDAERSRDGTLPGLPGAAPGTAGRTPGRSEQP